MVTFAETFQQWADFPNGLSVLVVDRDTKFLHDITHKLESYHYLVTSFSSREEACEALASHTQTFHVALVEAMENNGADSSKILAFSKDLPIIMMLVMENMSMMVKSIAHGAVEFLLKPLSEDKLKNIWQHVVRKALDSRESLRPGYLEQRITTALKSAAPHDQPACSIQESNISDPESLEMKPLKKVGGSHVVQISVTCERFAVPSTPQLEQSGSLGLQEGILDESPRSQDSTEVCNYKGRVHLESAVDKLSCSTMATNIKPEEDVTPFTLQAAVAVKKEEKAMDEQAQIFCCTIPMLESALHNENTNTMQTNEWLDADALELEIISKNERLVIEGSKCEEKARVAVEIYEMSSTEDHDPRLVDKDRVSHSDNSRDNMECLNADSTCQSVSLEHDRSRDETRDESKRKSNDPKDIGKDAECSKKKIKVDWTADLHRRFVQAVEFLGVEQAIPSRILELMKVDGLTRHNVASHLQKYRSHKKHMHAREVEAKNWHHNRYNYARSPWNRVGQNASPIWIQPCQQVVCPPLHVWGHPRVDHAIMHVIPQYIQGSNTWQAFDYFSWRQPMADSWVPGMPSATPCFGMPSDMKFYASPGHVQGATSGADDADCTNRLPNFKHHPPKELLDAAISEALNNPWMPLPLGLKPPSMESVMAELQHQGIETLSSLS